MKDINIVDVEASGLHFDAYPIEVAVSVGGSKYSWLIKPEDSWTYWSEDAESLHGISRKFLSEEGKPAESVVEELDKIVGRTNGLLYSDAAHWDLDWMRTLYYAVSGQMNFNVVSLFDLLTESQALKFQQEKTKLAASGNYHLHRAAEDVGLIHQAYLNVIK